MYIILQIQEKKGIFFIKIRTLILITKFDPCGLESHKLLIYPQ